MAGTAPQGGGARPGRRPRSVDESRWVTLEDGDGGYIGNLPRNDLRKLAEALNVPAGGNVRNTALISAIRAALSVEGAREALNSRLAAPVAAQEPTRAKPNAAEVLRKADAARKAADEAAEADRKARSAAATSSYPATRYCSNPDHPAITVRSEADEAFARTCPVCGNLLTGTKPNEPEPEAVQTGVVVRSDPADARRIAELERLLAEATATKSEAGELRHFAYDRALRWLSRGQHLFLAGDAGTGKSRLAAQLAAGVGAPLYEVKSCNPDMSIVDLTGYRTADGSYSKTPLRRALETPGSVFCLDEADHGDPGVIGALNSLLSDGTLDFPDGVSLSAPEGFRVILTANTWGTGPNASFVGAVEIDAATRNRFARVFVPIDEALEQGLVERIAPDQADLILSVCRTIRARLLEHDLRFVMSPRDSVRVALAVADGDTILSGLEACEVIAADAAEWALLTDGLEVE